MSSKSNEYNGLICFFSLFICLLVNLNKIKYNFFYQLHCITIFCTFYIHHYYQCSVLLDDYYHFTTFYSLSLSISIPLPSRR